MAMQQERYDDQTKRSKKRTRLIIDIVPELRRRIKIAAAENDLSVHKIMEYRERQAQLGALV